MQYFKIVHSEGTRMDKMTNQWQWITEGERERRNFDRYVPEPEGEEEGERGIDAILITGD